MVPKAVLLNLVSKTHNACLCARARFPLSPKRHPTCCTAAVTPHVSGQGSTPGARVRAMPPGSVPLEVLLAAQPVARSETGRLGVGLAVQRWRQYTSWSAEVHLHAAYKLPAHPRELRHLVLTLEGVGSPAGGWWVQALTPAG